MLDWHSCQICNPLEIKLLLLFESDLVAHPEDRFSQDMAHIIYITVVTVVASS